MNALLRHVAVRLWLTGMAGGLFSMMLLPGWARIFGLNWLVLPVGGILAVSFGATGWIMNRLGVALTRRRVQEAAAWERAGMIREAGIGFQCAAALFDSFWLSPFFRRRKAPWLHGILARFHLSQFPGSSRTRSLVAGYLRRYPQDRIVAEAWLEDLVSREHFSDEEHAAAARVGETLDHHQAIGRLLLQFCLAGGRIDFDAQMIYRQAWKTLQPLETGQVHELARLLLNESIINPWSFQVYLEALRTGMADARAGVAAGLLLVPLGEEGRRDQAAARELLAGLEAGEIERLGEGFKPPEGRPVLSARGGASRSGKSMLPGIFRAATTAPAEACRGIRDFFISGRGRFAGIKLRHVLFGVSLCCACSLALLVVLVGRPPKAPPASAKREVGGRVPVENNPVVTDPFTIQVAAYLNARDAQKVVDQLIDEKMAAFWTRATGANRTWYQVKVSHFPTRQEAQQFGRALKSRGLIDDFFVADYSGSGNLKTPRKNP